MKSFLRSLCALLISSACCQAAEMVGEYEVRTHHFTGGAYQNEPFRYLLLSPQKIEPGRRYPLILFLHGAGERGNDPAKLHIHFPVQMAQPEWRAKYPCFVLVPQCRDEERWMGAPWSRLESSPLPEKPSDQLQMAIEILEHSLKSLPVDAERVYLTGLSMGGYGSWELAMRRPELFAAVAPVCGGGDETQAARIKSIPIWAAHGDQDTAVPVERSRRMVEAVRKAGGNIKYTEYAGVGHNSWTPFYSDPEGVLPWMFQQKRPAKK